MQKTLISTLLAVFSTFTGVASATTLSVSTSGTFSSTDTATSLSAPGANWALNFYVNSQPVTYGTRADSFDVTFSNFSYTLNGTTLAETPSSIRFQDSASLGLFTVFFGPESGILNGGNYTPEFVFYGPQIYSGSVTNPTVLTGSFPVSESIFSDSDNFDDQYTPGTTVLISASAVPEPATWGLLSLALVAVGGFGFVQARRA